MLDPLCCSHQLWKDLGRRTGFIEHKLDTLHTANEATGSSPNRTISYKLICFVTYKNYLINHIITQSWPALNEDLLGEISYQLKYLFDPLCCYNRSWKDLSRRTGFIKHNLDILDTANEVTAKSPNRTISKTSGLSIQAVCMI